MIPTSSRRSTRAGLADVELATLAQTGDRAAFGELVRRHGSSVRALLRRLGAEPATADDIAQDAFLTAFERIGEFRGQGAFAGWVRRIAARLYLKRCKRQVLATSWEGGETDYLLVAPGPPSPTGKLDLEDALAQLKPAERLCVTLCCGAGFSHAEAAEVLKTPLGTVKSHVRRGLDKMKAQLTLPPEAVTVTMRGRHV